MDQKLLLKLFSILSVVILSLSSKAMASGHAMPLETVDHVELSAYLGTWNELYRIPNEFQDDKPEGLSTCFNTTAEYQVISDRKISVLNSCQRVDKQGEIIGESAPGTAWIANTKTNAELRVTFIPIPIIKWLGTGDYNIVGLGPINSDGKYSWAMVGSKNRNYAWILARTKTLSGPVLEDIMDRFKSLNFEVDSFISTQK